MANNNKNAVDLDALFDDLDAEFEAELEAEPEPTDEEVAAEAAFLKGWAKGRAIAKADFGVQFYKCGKLMHQLEPKMVAALLATGRVVGTVQRFTVAP